MVFQRKNQSDITDTNTSDLDEVENVSLDLRDNDDFDDDYFEDAAEGVLIPRAIKEMFASQGYDLRMVRITVGGDTDLKSVQKRTMQGWTFVRPEEIKAYMGSSFLGRSFKGVGQFGTEHDLVTNGDLALMKIQQKRRQRLIERQMEANQDQSRQADAASNQYLKFSNESKTQVQTGYQPKNRSASFKDPLS